MNTEINELRKQADEIMSKLKDVQRRLDEKIEESEKVKPLFPVGPNCFFVSGPGAIFLDEVGLSSSKHANQGRTSYTRKGAELIAKREAARARILEAINQANKGDNGFRIGGSFKITYNHSEGAFVVHKTIHLQAMPAEFHFRCGDDAKELLKDPKFVADYKLYLGRVDDE